MRRLRLLLGLLVGTIVLSGCDFDVYQLPLPGGADTGDDPITVEVEFVDVLDLVPMSAVKVSDVTVGKVTDVDLDGYTARVTLELRNDLKLPDDTIASIRQTSLLGEKFISLAAPPGGGDGELGQGDTISLEQTGRNPEVEEVLGALSLVLNGGGVAQLKTITTELNLALEGREDSARSVLTQIDSLVGQLDDRKADIVNAIESLNRLALGARKHQTSIDNALEELPSALDSIDRQRDGLVRMLKGLNRLGDVGVRVIQQTKDSTVSSLRQLEPLLTQIGNAGDSFIEALHLFYAFPFVDEVVGRDPQVARNLHMGDYVNLSVELDLDLTNLDVPGLPCFELEAIQGLDSLADMTKLCQGLQGALQQCLNNPGPNCAQLPVDLIDAVCDAVSLPLPVLCRPSGNRTTSGANSGANGGVTGGVEDLLDVLDKLGLGGALDGLGLNRPGVGPPEQDSVTAPLPEGHDAALVELLAGPLATTSEGGSGR